jgi:hypothetical protein
MYRWAILSSRNESFPELHLRPRMYVTWMEENGKGYWKKGEMEMVEDMRGMLSRRNMARTNLSRFDG